MKPIDPSRLVPFLGRAACAAAGLAVAGVAHAHPGAIAGAEQSVQALLAFFADPENVRGAFGAAAGAIASVVAARPFNRRRPPSPPAAPRPPAAKPAADANRADARRSDDA